jgi:hypothetical protein
VAVNKHGHVRMHLHPECDSAPQTICELCGLIARQQARLWKDWHPWLALLGVAALVGIRLNFTAGALSGVPWINLRTYLTHGVGYHHGLTTSEQVTSTTAL